MLMGMRALLLTGAYSAMAALLERVPAVASVAEMDPTIFAAVVSRRSGTERRAAMRAMNKAAMKSLKNMDYKFALCNSGPDGADDGLDAAIAQEQQEHLDIMLLGCQEGSAKGLLTSKVMYIMENFLNFHADHSFLMQLDDDTFVHWRKLVTTLKTKNTLSSYVGVPVPPAAPCRNPEHKWYEPFHTYPARKYPRAMASSSGYLLGRDLVTAVMKKNITQGRVLWRDFRAVGLWVQMHEDNGGTVKRIEIPGVRAVQPAETLTQLSKLWGRWGKYPHTLHHGLSSGAITCLSDAAEADDPHRDITGCFMAEDTARDHDNPGICQQERHFVDTWKGKIEVD